MRGFNIITDESELTFMVMAANRPLLKWMWTFIKNALAPNISSVSSICVDRFIVQAHNRDQCNNLVKSLHDATEQHCKDLNLEFGPFLSLEEAMEQLTNQSKKE